MNYTSFGIAVIESIWPHPSGYDYAGSKDAVDDSEQGLIYGSPATDVVGHTFHEDSVETSGWYKIVPLNVVSFKTQSSTNEGNKWSVTFTADDLIMVENKETDSPGIEGNALLSDILDSLKEAGQGALSSVSANDLISKSRLSNVSYASRRISLKDNFFSIQDIVTPGDTVTLWFYNDPSEFFPYEAVKEKFSKTLDVELDFKEVIGSGDRRAQYKSSDDQYSSEFKTGLPSHLYALAIDKATGKKTKTTFTTKETDLMARTSMQDSIQVDEISGATNSIITSIAGSLSQRAFGEPDSLGLNPNSIQADALGLYLTNEYPKDFLGYSSVYKVADNAVAKREGWGRSEGIKYEKTNAERVSIQYYILSLTRLPLTLEGRADAELQAQASAINSAMKAKGKTVDKPPITVNPTRPKQFEPDFGFDISLYLQGRAAYKKLVMRKVEEVAKSLTASTISNRLVNTKSVIKRKSLSNSEFGENCYLIMKGHIQGVTNSRSASANTITINGSGLEYPLEKHLVFYDSTLDILGSNTYLQDYRNAVMSSMNPAAQMLFVITKYAPKQIKWGPRSSTDNTSRALMQITTPSSSVGNLAPGEQTTSESVIKRGNLIIDRHPSLYQGMSAPVADKSEKGGIPAKALLEHSRMFTPLNHYSLYRLGESIRSYLVADPSGQLGNTTFPHSIDDKTPVLQMVKQIAGAPTIMEFFVDSLGYMMYRVAGEAWERTPRPEYTPTIEEENVINVTFSESDENIATLVDVTMQQNAGMGASNTSTSHYLNGRAIARTAKIPISKTPEYTKMTQLSNTLSPELFRYGLRYQVFTDVYGGTVDAARDKANTIYRFYGAPIKRAEVMLIGDPTYRAGDTVLMHLPTIKKRSKKRTKLSSMLNWLIAIRAENDYVKMYIGDEGRLKNTSYYSNPAFSLDNSGMEYMDKHAVLDNMVATLQWMSGIIGEDTPITWDNFPVTLWWYLKDKKSKKSAEIIKAHAVVLNSAVNPSASISSSDLDLVRLHLSKLRFNNYMCMSFYIDGVSQTYEYNQASTTNLTLSYGQENIALVHPTTGANVGFFSVDRRIRDIYPDPIEFDEIRDGEWRNLFKAQFLEDLDYKNGSFVHRSAEIRNTANYLHALATRFGDVGSDLYYTGAK